MRDPKTGRFPPGNGAGKGTGLWGPPKGASTSRIKPGDPDGIQRMSHDPAIKALNDARRKKVLDLYEAVVDDPSHPVMARITAGDKLLDRIDGKAPQTNINLGADDVERMSDDEIAAERARIDAALAQVRKGRQPEGDTD